MNHYTTFQTALASFSPVERTALCSTMLDVMRVNPELPEAWLYLGLCSETPAQKRECLERALRMDPLNPTTHAALNDIQAQEAAAMRSLLSGCRPLAAPAHTFSSKHLGLYLQEQGVHEEYIQQALRIQRAAPISGRRPLLGEILVAQGWVAPERLAELLIAQARTRLDIGAFERPVMLGEFLVHKGYIMLDQLHRAMLSQLRTIQAGGYRRLGEVLLEEHYISEAQLQQALLQQEEEYKSLLY